jgi:hypothetical protein
MTNSAKKRSGFLTKFIAVIALTILTIFVTFSAAKFWKSNPQNSTKEEASDHEIIGLADDFSGEDRDDELSDLTVNEMREKGAEFIYQILLKNQGKIEDLQNQIQSLRAEVQKYRSQEKIGKMVVVYVDLRDKIIAGKPYSEEMRSFEILAASDDSLAAKTSKLRSSLEKFSTKEKLQKNFADLIPEIILNKKKGADQESLLGKARQYFSRLIIIRRIDQKNPQDVDSAVVKIEKALAAENYQEALASALSLDQSYHEILKNFLDELSATLEFHQIDREILNYLKSLS